MTDWGKWINAAAGLMGYAAVGYIETHGEKLKAAPIAPISPKTPVPADFLNTLPPIDLKLPLVSMIANDALEQARLAPDLETRDRIQNEALRRISQIVRAKPNVTDGRAG